MEKTYVEHKTFDHIDFSENGLALGNYENCTFTNCSFLNFDLSGTTFSECIFEQCDLSMATLAGTALREVRFKDSRLLGLHFEDCNDFLFSASFEDCRLNLSSFCRLKLKSTLFKNCNLQEVDFTEADLTSATFDHCDLRGAIFENTKLEAADLRTAYNFAINPALNSIRKAKFSLMGIKGLLEQYDITIE